MREAYLRDQDAHERKGKSSGKRAENCDFLWKWFTEHTPEIWGSEIFKGSKFGQRTNHRTNFLGGLKASSQNLQVSGFT